LDKSKQYVLNDGEKIFDLDKFINSHKSIINSKSSETIKQPYKNRIIKLFEYE
jgi:hypothetical protein